MPLRLEDTRSGERRTVRARPGRPVTMYVCGPTVYDRAHVGHARTYLFFDVVRRFLTAEGQPVHHVMNVTDFEDKIDRRAAELGLSWRALARREEAGFLRDLRSFGILPPHDCPRASDFAPQIVRVAESLAQAGRVRQEGDLWIYTPPEHPDTTNFPTDSELSRHAVEEPDHPFPRREGALGEFVIWKRQRPPLPSWPSRWGPGSPGWHLECYAMARRILEVPVDVHGGGLDLIYPHHHAENEIALALDGQPFSRLFVHTAFVLQGGAKMSKSTGNLISLRDALKRSSPGGLRWYLLATPYRVRLEWDVRALDAANREYRLLLSHLDRWLAPGAGGTLGASLVERLAEAARGDLSEGLAADRVIQRLRELSNELGRDPSGRVAAGERPAARRALRAIEERTGIRLVSPARARSGRRSG
ncbi:MAG TPA: class I tRNA ligase family protein [Thermoplasmata archaeon]|nr:class I tRNA ligase family protein [Thermoplasmata archaeon]